LARHSGRLGFETVERAARQSDHFTPDSDTRHTRLQARQGNGAGSGFVEGDFRWIDPFLESISLLAALLGQQDDHPGVLAVFNVEDRRVQMAGEVLTARK